jgi:hypothetical protein
MLRLDSAATGPEDDGSGEPIMGRNERKTQPGQLARLRDWLGSILADRNTTLQLEIPEGKSKSAQEVTQFISVTFTITGEGKDLRGFSVYVSTDRADELQTIVGKIFEIDDTGELRPIAYSGDAKPASKSPEAGVERISPIAYLRSMWTLFWACILHPFTPTAIDLSTGRALARR